MHTAYNPEFAFIQVFVPAIVALVVVALSHLFTRRRDHENRLRAQRIDYLVGVFRALSKANHHPRLHEVAEDLEQAIVDIQLLGTPQQVSLAQKFANELAAEHEAELDELLLNLRDSLRSELDAESLSDSMVWLRISKETNNLAEK